jgi:hypothetical protein
VREGTLLEIARDSPDLCAVLNAQCAGSKSDACLSETKKLHPSETDVTLRCEVRGLFENFVDWRQCAAVVQRGAVTVMSSCGGGGNVVVA